MSSVILIEKRVNQAVLVVFQKVNDPYFYAWFVIENVIFDKVTRISLHGAMSREKPICKYVIICFVGIREIFVKF